MMDRSAVVCCEPPDGPKVSIASADGTRRVPATMAAGPACVALMAALLAAAGCRGNYPPTVPVRGRVTFQGGAWPDEGTIYFLPEKPAEGHTHHPGMAPFGPDGSFRVRTFTAGDGLAPGTYVVRIECWKVPPTMGGPPAESYLPPDYHSGRRSLPKLVVEPGARRVWFEYDVAAEGDLPQRGAVRPVQGNGLEPQSHANIHPAERVNHSDEPLARWADHFVLRVAVSQGVALGWANQGPSARHERTPRGTRHNALFRALRSTGCRSHPVLC